MTHQSERPDGPDDGQHWFTTTHWSVVLSARVPSPQATNALEALCRTYWPPLYTYIRRRGFDVHAAQDLTQQFITHLLAKDFLGGLSPEKGRFRSFLLASLKNFLVNEHERATTQKRGGRVKFVSMDADDEEQWLCVEPVTNETAEDVFDRRWALTILQRAFEALRQELAAAGKAVQFDRLKVFLEGEVDRGDYNVAAQDLQMSPGAVSVAVHRLRQRYRELLRREVADTLGAPEQVEEELRDVMRALSR